MAESATPTTPNDIPDVPRDPGYVALVQHILWSLDVSTGIAAKNNGGSSRTQARIEAYNDLLHFVRGYEGTDLDGLRARFGRQQ